jgi:hypothetical protein
MSGLDRKTAARAKTSFNAAGSKTAKPKPFSLRLTFEERAKLNAMAGDRPLGSFIRDRLLGENAGKRAFRSRRPAADKRALARALNLLGQSRLSSNMNQIAKAVHLGTLPVGPDLEAELAAACADIREMRDALIAALGPEPPSAGGPQ